jgi:hypothetical protein
MENKNPLTYGDIVTQSYSVNSVAPQNPIFPYGPNDEPHAVGEIWASSLFQVRSHFKIAHEQNDDILLQILTDALKLTPPNQTMVEGRDAILLADMVRNSGQNQCLIWRGFAERGLGYGAVSEHSVDMPLAVIESFVVPEGC